MEAWEHIAPELPPGWSVVEQDGRYEPCCGNGMPAGRFTSGHQIRDNAVSDAWHAFGVTRRAYAELIAPQRVREAAEATGMEVHGVRVWLGPVCVVEVVFADALDEVEGQGPDICTAAWEAIQALGGGE